MLNLTKYAGVHLAFFNGYKIAPPLLQAMPVRARISQSFYPWCGPPICPVVHLFPSATNSVNFEFY